MKYLPATDNLGLTLSCLAIGIAIAAGGCGPKPEFKLRTTTELLEMSGSDMRPLDGFHSRRGRLSGKLPKGMKSRTFDTDNMTILFKPPHGLFLTAKYFGTPVLAMGSNDERYWIGAKLGNEVNSLWWGRWAYVGQSCSQTHLVPMSCLTEALGRVDLRELSGMYIGPVMRREAPYHIFMYNAVDEISGHWYLAKEIYLDAADRLKVEKIIYYKYDGTVDVEMYMSHYRKVEHAYMPNVIELKMRDGAYLKFVLGKIERQVKFHEKAFLFPGKGTYEDEQQLDTDCGGN